MNAMSRIAIKICGLSTPDTLEAALTAQASHIGMVFFSKSPRHVALDRAGDLAQRVPTHVTRVGVMVDPDDALLDSAVAAGRLDALQLHGRENAERVAQIRSRYRLPTWKAISVKTRADLDAARAYAGAADVLIFDAKTPDGAALPGGMGLRFDWKLLENLPQPLPWALSGGLDADNVREAVGVTGARLVDVSSGVESAPGVKDVAKIAAFLQAVAQC